MGRMLDSAIAFFKEDGWPFSQDEGANALVIPFSAENGEWVCIAQSREEKELFLFYSVCPLHAPADKRMATAEFLTRANYGLVIGNFELDMDEGEIRFKSSIDVEGDRLTEALIRQIVYPNVLTMDRYLPGIEAVINGDVPPHEAISRIEDEDAAPT